MKKMLSVLAMAILSIGIYFHGSFSGKKNTEVEMVSEKKKEAKKIEKPLEQKETALKKVEEEIVKEESYLSYKESKSEFRSELSNLKKMIEESNAIVLDGKTVPDNLLSEIKKSQEKLTTAHKLLMKSSEQAIEIIHAKVANAKGGEYEK